MSRVYMTEPGGDGDGPVSVPVPGGEPGPAGGRVCSTVHRDGPAEQEEASHCRQWLHSGTDTG